MADLPVSAVREARPGDEAELARLATQLGFPMTEQLAVAQLAELAEHAGRTDHALLVAPSPAGLLGWVQISVRRMFETPSTAEIAALIVDQDHRSGGVGRLLVAAAERWAVGRGCRTVRVRSNVVNERAHLFYEREGYERVKMQQVFDKTLVPGD